MMGRVLILALGIATLVGSWVMTCQLWRYRDVSAGVAWLEPREFERLSAVTLGTGSAYENPQRLGPATAIALGDLVVLVDAGRGVAEALRKAEIPVQQPARVFLTSLLPENSVGLDDLLLTGWLAPRQEPLVLMGPPGTRALAEALLAAHAPAISMLETRVGLPARGAALDVTEVGDGWSMQLGEITVSAAAVGRDALPGLAYRFEASGRAIVVSGAGPERRALTALARGAAVLVAEGFHAESVEMAIDAGAPDPERLRAEAALHMPFLEVGKVATDAGVPLLVLTRLRPPPLFDAQYDDPLESVFHGRVQIAGDGDTFSP